MRKEEPSKFHGSPSGNSTFIISILLVLAIVVWGVISGSSFQAVGNAAFNFISDKFGWFYVLSMTGFVVFAAWMGFVSRYRHMRLGPDESRPEYSNVSWFGMLFSAGMGIGLIFWGVAEPLSFWVSPPGLEPGSTQAAQFAFRKVFLHWGLHPWAAYSVLALSIAYFQYRKGFSGLISALFIPLLGEKRVNGALGRIIDILAVFVTITGIGISLGMGAMQINSGLNVVFGIPRGKFSLLIIIIVMAVVYIGAALAGVNKAVQKIGNFNIAAIAVILVAVFLFGPTVDILRCLTESSGDYIQTLPASAMQTGAFGNSDWYGAWTVFYWAWWIAWAPFSAMFIARISKGRTVREFVTGVLLLPTGASFVWFSVFGVTGIQFGQEAGIEHVVQIISDTPSVLFAVIGRYPLGTVLSVAIIVLLGSFFTTSANAATLALSTLSSNGDPNPSNSRKLIWGVLQAALVVVLMFCTEEGQGLDMLKMISIVAAFPFVFILIGSIFSLLKALKSEPIGKGMEQAASSPAIEEPKS